MFNHLRDSCGALDHETRRLYLKRCHSRRQRSQRRLRESISDTANPIEDMYDEGTPQIFDKPTKETNTDNDEITADQISNTVATEETTRDN